VAKKRPQVIERLFTGGEASRIVDMHYMTLDYWARSKFLEPSARAANGRGRDRGYTFRDLVELRVAKRLRDAGISLQALREVRELLAKERNLEAPFAETYLVTNSKDVFELRRGRNEVWSLLAAPGQRVYPWIILDLTETVNDVAKAASVKGEREKAA
jgi:DNA-binding transcriptional MerR regulator